jgi:hypothetical protein
LIAIRLDVGHYSARHVVRKADQVWVLAKEFERQLPFSSLIIL